VRRIRAEARLMDGSLAVGYTSDISETGLSLTFEEPVPLAGTIAVRLLDWPAGQISIFQAQVVQSTVDESNKHHVGLKLVNRTPEQHSRLIRHMYGGASLLPLPPSASTWSILKQWMGTPFRQSSMQRRAGRRRCPRFPLSLACVLDASGVFSIGFTNEISENGLKMTLKPNARLFVGDDVRVYIQWNKREITDWPAQLVRIEPTSEHEYQLGIQFNGLSRKERLVLIRHLYNQCDRMVRVAPAVSRAVDCILTLPSGQMARGVTVEMSEMGLVVGIQGVLTVRDGEAVSIQLYWSDRTTSTYTGLVKSTFDPSQYGLHSPPLALIYFDAMSLHVMDDLSRRIEMDMPNGEALPFGVLKD
jgi:c-di-GMP-binding flagellar brake protein YcgR